jgi:hypothetical protein
MVDIEMQSSSFYACFEEAINEYGAAINMFNMRDNMLTLQGSEFSSNTNLSQKVIKPNMSRIIDISAEYGAEAGVGGTIDWKTAHVDTQDGVQIYDLELAVSKSLYDEGITDEHVIHNNIELKRVFHHAPPAINRYFNPFIGNGNQYLMSSFGFDKVSGVNYIMMPLFNDLLRIQAIELSDTIRKSAYSFEVINNKIKLFPVPKYSLRVYFNYIFKSDRSDPFYQGNEDGSTFISDVSNAPYGIMKYSTINSVGTQWIKKWGLALAKEYLGSVRSKYANIPSLNQEITLDGPEKLQQAAAEKELLSTELKEQLEQLTRKQQLMNKQEESDALLKILTNVPIGIYVG